VLWGDFLALLTAGLWGLYSVLARIVTRERPSLEATAYSTWLALPVLVVLAGWDVHTAPPLLSVTTGLAMVYIGIFPTVIAFLSWNEGVRRLGPNQAMAFYNLLPVFSVTLGIIFLGESLTWLAVLGGLMVVAGGLVTASARH
jgi:drug/metabolite transporter (DMT)-like permease